MSQQSSWILDVTAETFERDVIQRSLERPVVVDLWAPWCEPCRQLTPLLEKLADENRGRFVLAKINIDEQPEIAQAFQVQSIPFVVAIHEGQPVDQFMGVLPEDRLRAWIEPLLPSPAQEVTERAQALEAEDPAAAEQLYREAAALSPTDDAIRVHLARVLLAQDRDEECRRIIDDLAARGYLEPEAERIKSQLDLRSAAEEAGGLDEARQAAAAAPDDLHVQLKLADALAVAGRHKEAMDVCLAVIARDRDGVGQQAKETMVRIFNMIGPASPLVNEYRRKLATAIY